MRISVDIVLTQEGEKTCLDKQIPFAWVEPISDGEPAWRGRLRHAVIACNFYSMQVKIFSGTTKELLQIRSHLENAELFVQNFSYRTALGREDLNQDLFAFAFSRKLMETMTIRYVEAEEANLRCYFDLTRYPNASVAPFGGETFLYKDVPPNGFEVRQYLDKADTDMVSPQCEDKFVGRALFVFKESDLQFPVNPDKADRAGKIFRDLTHRNSQILRSRSANVKNPYLLTHKTMSLVDSLNDLSTQELKIAYKQTVLYYHNHPSEKIKRHDHCLLYAYQHKAKLTENDLLKSEQLTWLPGIRKLERLSILLQAEDLPADWPPSPPPPPKDEPPVSFLPTEHIAQLDELLDDIISGECDLSAPLSKRLRIDCDPLIR